MTSRRQQRPRGGESVETRTFSDPVIPAYFQASGKPFKITPRKNPEGQVEFIVEGEDIDKAIEGMYANPSIGLLDFVKALKTFRSCTFTLKGGAR
jgi:hypothetical protein